jgi:type VI secretion system secreted protein VgrG
VNEEVIVDFLEGDPDRPIITGRVYNGKNRVPYALPANKTQYGIKTTSIEGSGFNELRFDDKGGKEEIYVHAQKAMLVEVKDTRTARITTDDNLEVLNGNYTATIKQGSVTIEAAKEIVFKVGTSKVTINTQGVTVDGTMLEMKGSASVKLDSPMTTAGGSGKTSITGALITIG